MNGRLGGVLAALLAVSIWGGWIVFVRLSVSPEAGGEPPLTPMDVAFLRNVAPAILLAPVWLRPSLRESMLPSEAPVWTIAALNCWGVPFLALMGLGLARADSALGGQLAPGLMPLLAAGLAWLIFRQVPGRLARIGLPLIGLGAAATLVGRALAGGAAAETLAGAPFIIGASLCWACYAVAFPHSRLTPLRATGIIGLWSTLIAAAIIVLGAESNLLTAGWETVLYGFIGHGLGSGAISVAAFSFAISRLGTGRAAAFSALVPIIAGTLGYLLIGDGLSTGDLTGLLLAGAGVLIVNLGGPARPAASTKPAGVA